MFYIYIYVNVLGMDIMHLLIVLCIFMLILLKTI